MRRGGGLRALNLVVHDFGGYAFALELSRELAGRGHTVRHLYCPNILAGFGDLKRRPDDPPGLAIEAIDIGRPFVKYSPARRIRDEWAYGRAAAERIRRVQPDVVMSANALLVSQAIISRAVRRSPSRGIVWWQDSYGVGVGAVLGQRAGALGRQLGRVAIAVERRFLRRSDHVIAIGPELADLARRFGVEPDRLTLIPNWAPMEDLQSSVATGWKTLNVSDRPRTVLYAGALGLKHDVNVLLDLAVALGDDTDTNLVVVSQGPGRDHLEKERAERSLANLALLDYQPPEVFPSMLAAADVLVAVLTPEAGRFSVPSKIATYLCAGRPIVAAMPSENLAATTIVEAGAGIIVPPGDADALAAAVRSVLNDDTLAKEMGERGRDFAERSYAIGGIADRFESVLDTVALRPRPPAAGPAAIAIDTVRRIWRHPGNAGRRSRAVGGFVGWQVWQRLARRPWTVRLHGGRRIRLYPHSPAASAVLYYGGLPDFEEMQFLLDWLQPGDTFLDVGANAGVYSVLATTVPEVNVVAVEPATESVARLAENVALNDVEDRVALETAAVGDRTGASRMTTGLGPMNRLTIEANGSEPTEVVTLDQIAERRNLERVALVKLDIEGAEVEALNGARRLLENERPALIVEVNDRDGLVLFSEEFGYVPVRYDAGTGSLTAADVPAAGNAILVPDADAARARLRR